jgi:hypothetical protein
VLDPGLLSLRRPPARAEDPESGCNQPAGDRVADPRRRTAHQSHALLSHDTHLLVFRCCDGP